jgi:hypothetical protein
MEIDEGLRACKVRDSLKSKVEEKNRKPTKKQETVKISPKKKDPTVLNKLFDNHPYFFVSNGVKSGNITPRDLN